MTIIVFKIGKAKCISFPFSLSMSRILVPAWKLAYNFVTVQICAYNLIAFGNLLMH